MERTKKTKILRLKVDPNKRLLFMSDIHGDIRLFQEALKKVEFSSSDILFVIGDMIEKGDASDNLKMLRYVLELSKQENIYFMAGNCDEIFRFILPPLDHQKFLYYALERKKSVINDLAEEMNWPLSKEMDVDGFVSELQKRYPEFYEYTDRLNDVIFVNDQLVLVHGGILDIKNISKNAIDLLKFDRFAEISGPQPKLMIVGHYPTRNYRSETPNVDPIFDFRKRIISIDGGNNIVKGGQINVVILESLSTMKFSFQAVDHYRKYQIQEDVTYTEPLKKFNIQFGHNEVEIINKDLDFYYIRLVDTQDAMWVHNSFVYSYEGKNYCYDGSNCFISLKKGDIISVIKIARPYSLVKFQGTIGLIETKYIDEDFISHFEA